MASAMHAEIIKKNIPHHFQNTYTDKVAGYVFLYNPISEKGLVVLNKEAFYLYSLVNGERSLDDILILAKKEDKNTSFFDLKKVFNNFISSEIIYFDKPKSNLFLLNKKPTTLNVWFHITNQCNLRCTYCYVSKTPNKMSNEIAKKAIEKIFYSAKKHGFNKIVFKFAGGEPLLEFNKILDVVYEAKKLGSKNNIDLDFVIISNGILLTDQTCQIIKKNGLRVAVSFDGLGKYHDQTRVFANGSGTFKYVEKGINNILKYKIPFNVSITITSKNIENIPVLTDYLLKKKITFAYNFYRENPNVKEKLDGNDKKLVRYLKKAYSIISKSLPRDRIINGLLDRVTFTKPHLFACGMGQNYLVIRHDGKLLSCQMTQNKVIGSIEDPDLIETMIKGNFITPKGLTVENKIPCKNCQWKYICCGGCPLLTKNQKGRYDVSSSDCFIYKELIPEVLKIEARRLIKYDQS